MLVCDLCRERNLAFIYDAAMERLLFDGRPLIYPLRFEGMADRTVVIGSMSKEHRMIGWRVGWVCGPAATIEDLGWVHIYNTTMPTAIARAAASRPCFAARDTCRSAWMNSSAGGTASLRACLSGPSSVRRAAGRCSGCCARLHVGGGIASPAPGGGDRCHRYDWLGRHRRGPPRPIRLQCRAQRTAADAPRTASQHQTRGDDPTRSELSPPAARAAHRRLLERSAGGCRPVASRARMPRRLTSSRAADSSTLPGSTRPSRPT